ncbi:MAG: TetR/AcrR family transcriptional regulator [Rhodococcus sp. (in: high G+C Gram-positive bacteria)]|uniref:TetR/AcrR family transcriptional regulator n=1 Tax=Rhodococcus sp. TaxID=1831 RepID=UPI003BAE2DCA
MKPPTTAPGRPRDPGLSGRIMAAALEEYARTGWGSFTMQGVARRAGVGKSALYLRWSTREQLLVDSIESVALPLAADLDTGCLRSDLTEMAAGLFRYFLDPIGWSTLRIAVDVAVTVEFAELEPFQERIVDALASGALVMFTRAAERGEIKADVPLQPLLETLFGSILVHALALPPTERDNARNDVETHVTPLVDVIFRAATSR